MGSRRISPELDNALGFNIYRVALLFRKELMKALSDYRMTPEQWQVMQTLWSTEGQLTQNDVAHLTLRDKHTVSRILARLERDGWIKKHPHPTDARAYIVAPTDQAKTLRHEVPSKLHRHFADILSELGTGEAEELLYLLKKLRHRLGDIS
ncbi:MAG: winged helix-turn-helix transcriptional regulator [Leptolyngbya sp. SIO1E4]|nr:winged helix-turn-helix transcriptional regulator [Leptolyngbya sp. SIO1E4]